MHWQDIIISDRIIIRILGGLAKSEYLFKRKGVFFISTFGTATDSSDFWMLEVNLSNEITKK